MLRRHACDPGAIAGPAPEGGSSPGALSALAIAQPLFDLISKNPDFLAARWLIGRQVVTLGLVLVLLPPLLALAVEALAGLGRPWRAKAGGLEGFCPVQPVVA
jgi:hypothetical protein